MNIIKTLIINGVLVTFPLLVHEYFIVYIKNMKNKKIEISLSIAIIVSLYLAMYHKQFVPASFQITTIVLPVMISYLMKKPNLSLVISIIEIEYLVRELNYNIIPLIIFFSILFISYKIYERTNKDSNFLVNTSIILIVLILLINMKIRTLTDILNILIVISMYIFIIKIIKKGVEISKNILNLHTNLKEFEKEKDIRLSLFKITHEIKNPISVVKGYLDMFNPNDKIKSEKYINIIKDEIDRTLNLLNDFMEFSKIKIEEKYTDINILFDEIKEILIPFFRSNNVNYYFEIEDNIKTYIDKKRMKQVIINIIKNAVESCNKCGNVMTTVFTDEKYLMIYVKDNGTGMSKEVLDNMLTPFYTTKEKGTGLGVSLSKEIIEAHKGKLTYSSIPEQGTICKVTIPLKKEKL